MDEPEALTEEEMKWAKKTADWHYRERVLLKVVLRCEWLEAQRKANTPSSGDHRLTCAESRLDIVEAKVQRLLEAARTPAEVRTWP